MAENLDIEGRMSVRSPMQWSPERHAGFSTVEDARKLCRPVTTQDGFGPDRVNVAAQRRDHDSMLNWMERLIRRRRECPEFGFGAFRLVQTPEPEVFAHRCDWGEHTVLALHNLSGRELTTSFGVEQGDDCEALVDLFAHDELTPGDDGRLDIALEPYAFRWYRLRGRGRRVAP